jgi:asparagine synthase (glutamine-hydrolysing)
MCGIAGMASFGSPVSEALVRRMTATLTHRGPDEDGYYTGAHAALGARRLSIIDVAGSHQPVHNEDRRVWAVFNGELYNFKALRAELEGLGHRFETQGDSEVVAHAWEEWGERSAARLRGMFAFALWDERQETLFLVRDRVGIKPLYWAWDGGTLLFGSEMKALLCARAEHPLGGLDPAALQAFLCFGYVPPPLSMFEGARCLPPGHQLLLRRGAAPVVRPYWELPRAAGQALLEDEAEASAEFRELLAGSVTDQMVSDVPIGAFLSGGVDSSTVVALMAQASSAPIRTFSIGFDETDFDELSFARRVGFEHDAQRPLLHADLHAPLLDGVLVVHHEHVASLHVGEQRRFGKQQRQRLVHREADAREEAGGQEAVLVLEAGAHAYVAKQNLAPLVPAVNRVLRAAREREIRRQSEAS